MGYEKWAFKVNDRLDPGQRSCAWEPGRYEDRRPKLLTSRKIRRSITAYFENRDFVEVDLPVLQISPGNERHIHAFRTEFSDLAGQRAKELYLRSSPEFACKKLLAAGETRLFTFAPSFRDREQSPIHHPQFTMLEWYRAHEDYHTLMADCAEILAMTAEAAKVTKFAHNGREIDPLKPPVQITVAEAFERFAGIDLLASIDRTGAPDCGALAEAAGKAGIRTAHDDQWSDIFSRILVSSIEPHLGVERATILADYPISEAALARPKADDPRVCERFELYACGLELANAFGELTDPVEQRRRFDVEMDARESLCGDRYPIDEDFLEAIGSMPEASGIALGFERLVMLATDAKRIEDVLWLPMDL